MALDFTFLKEDQIWGNDALDVIKAYGTKVAPTDLTVLLGGDMYRYAYNTSEDFPCKSWSASSGRGVRCVDYNGRKEWNLPCFRQISARPALPPSEASKISPSEAKTIDGIRVAEYGEYPQTVADDRTSKKLERLLESRFLRPTEKNYTFDSFSQLDYNTPFQAAAYPEYELDGKRYIRVLGRPHDDESCLSTGEQVESGKPYWVQVQPIEWLMDRSGTMVAKKCLFAGIQFDTKIKYDGDFSKTSMKQYLDTYFAKEMEPSKTIERTKSKKGLIALLSSLERGEIENDEKVASFREARKAVIAHALEGAEKLVGKEKRKAELSILRKTNVQTLRDAEGKARAKKMTSILKKKQNTK